MPLITELLSQLEYHISNNNTLTDFNFDLKKFMLKPSRLNDRWDLADLRMLLELAIINVINQFRKNEDSLELEDFTKWVR